MVQQSLLQFLQDLDPTCVRYHLLSTFLSNKSLIRLLLISRGCWSWCRFVGTSARREAVLRLVRRRLVARRRFGASRGGTSARRAASLWRVARRCFGSLCGGASARRTAGLQLQGRQLCVLWDDRNGSSRTEWPWRLGLCVEPRPGLHVLLRRCKPAGFLVRTQSFQ